MKEYKIYCLKHPDTDEIRYIGVTTSKYLSTRLAQHYFCANHNFQTHVAKWIRKIGKKPIIELIEACNVNQWEDREKYWIGYYDNLTNIHEGGKGVILDRTLTSIERSSSAKFIKVVQLDQKGDLINIFNSIKEAKDYIGAKSSSSIVNVLKGNYGCKTAFGFQWFYYDEYIDNDYLLRVNKKPIIKTKIKTYLYNLNFKLINVFNSQLECSKYLKTYPSSIIKATNRSTPIYNKYYIRDYKI